MKDNSLKAGKLLAITSGCYSSYGLTGFFVTLQAFNPKAMLDEYLSTREEEKEMYKFNESGFLAFLISKGLLLEIDYCVLHTGDYSTASEVEFYGRAD